MTTPKALAAAMQRRDADSILLREMQQMLRAELEKPPEAQDLDAVDEMTAAICELCGLEQAVAAHSRIGLETFRTHITPQIAATTTKTIPETTAEPIVVSVTPKRVLRWKKLAAVAASFAGAMLIGNIATKFALGDGLLTTGAKLMHGGIEFSMSEPEDAAEVLPENQNDPYGIQAECNSLGFNALTPQYIPEDLSDITHEYAYDESVQDVWYWFSNEEAERRLSMHFMHYEDESMAPNNGIPTQGYETEELMINNIPVHQVSNDEYTTYTFRYQNTTYVVDCTNLEPDECEAILYSFFDDSTNL